ncbi:PREDICTED: histone-lysine N-methyltransferase setd3 [Nelumbo nucifera]|uniref:Histone-lysine N-methyltransferase setd3 n=1 Tax=Nelumbo nucifera TaxID=4432 RepID=A0A1U8B4W9_NELNU|nr:PREDICTED: histone-lysine N-methyltransferase setd3 [Nelumbo nucifera]
MVNLGASKVLTATRDLISSSTTSLTHFRPLTCASASASTACHPARLVPHPPDLVKWVRQEGGFVHHGLKIAAGDSYGLGLVASEEIPKGSDLIALPSHLPLRFRSLDSEDGDGIESVLIQLARQVPEELWAMRLGLKLLQERAKVGSFWWPYISNLPETYSVPIFFPGDDIKNLQYAPLLYQVNKRCRFLLDFERAMKDALENVRPEDHPFGGQNIDASSLGWAMSAVSSRAFRLHGEQIPDGTHADIPMMLPLIDMCNHSFNPNAQIVQEKNIRNSNMLVKVVAEAHIKRDDTILLDYGCLNNDLFLLDYGFVILSNPYDCIELRYDGALLDAASMAAGVSSPNFSSPTQWQQQILAQLNLQGEDALLKVSLGGTELVEGRLLAALRVLLANDMETVQKHDLSTLKSLTAEAPLGISNEVAALRTVIALCVIALGHFPTKIMEDESLLKGASGPTELAIQFRVQKKSVIIDVMRDLTRRVKILLSKETAIAQG